MFGFNKQDIQGVGFRFINQAHTNVDDYVFSACMNKVLPAIEKACQQQIEIRNIGIGTHKIDKTDQMNIFFPG